MRTNRLGASTVSVTAMGLGTAQLGDLYESLDDERATAIVDAAWAAGIRYFDTAPHYGLGLAERRLGIALANRARSSFVLSSKVGRLIVCGTDGSLERRWDFSADGVARSIDESLGRLGLDRLDLVLLHDPAGHIVEAIDDAYPALARLKAQGSIGAIGVGTGDLDALAAFTRETEIDAVMIAGRYTLLEQPALASVVPAAREKGISILNAGVFNTGLLATAHPVPDSRYEYAAAPDALVQRATRIARAADAAGTSLPQAALKFAGRDPLVASVVVGADSPEQATANAAMFEEPRPMDALWAELEEENLL
jgi:D-threo-aldose 1-dehydrogenase